MPKEGQRPAIAKSIEIPNQSKIPMTRSRLLDFGTVAVLLHFCSEIDTVMKQQEGQ